ncbi:MAG: hypothetical protein WA865_01380, partial [Spirulinaceae cyanobacterium]
PTRKEVQKWIDECGKGRNLQNRVHGHIRYWITRRENPSLTHEQAYEQVIEKMKAIKFLVTRYLRSQSSRKYTPGSACTSRSYVY